MEVEVVVVVVLVEVAGFTVLVVPEVLFIVMVVVEFKLI